MRSISASFSFKIFPGGHEIFYSFNKVLKILINNCFMLLIKYISAKLGVIFMLGSCCSVDRSNLPLIFSMDGFRF